MIMMHAVLFGFCLARVHSYHKRGFSWTTGYGVKALFATVAVASFVAAILDLIPKV